MNELESPKDNNQRTDFVFIAVASNCIRFVASADGHLTAEGTTPARTSLEHLEVVKGLKKRFPNARWRIQEAND